MQFLDGEAAADGRGTAETGESDLDRGEEGRTGEVGSRREAVVRAFSGWWKKEQREAGVTAVGCVCIGRWRCLIRGMIRSANQNARFFHLRIHVSSAGNPGGLKLTSTQPSEAGPELEFFSSFEVTT